MADECKDKDDLKESLGQHVRVSSWLCTKVYKPLNSRYQGWIIGGGGVLMDAHEYVPLVVHTTKNSLLWEALLGEGKVEDIGDGAIKSRGLLELGGVYDLKGLANTQRTIDLQFDERSELEQTGNDLARAGVPASPPPPPEDETADEALAAHNTGNSSISLVFDAVECREQGSGAWLLQDGAGTSLQLPADCLPRQLALRIRKALEQGGSPVRVRACPAKLADADEARFASVDKLAGGQRVTTQVTILAEGAGGGGDHGGKGSGRGGAVNVPAGVSGGEEEEEEKEEEEEEAPPPAKRKAAAGGGGARGAKRGKRA